MGLFEAEVRSHTGEEDILTSRVFGTLEILDRTKFLIPVLKQCGVQLSLETVPESFTFNYWKGMGKRIPDVILENKLNLIFFENKLNASLAIHQLVEEYEDGIGCRKNFWLIAITSDWTEPPEVQKSREILIKKGIKGPRIQWVNWQKIYAILHSSAKNGSQTEVKLIGDLLLLLKAKGLSLFTGFEEAQLSSVAALWPKAVNFLEGCSAFFGTLSSRLHEKNITCIEKGYIQEVVQTGWRAMGLQDFAYWLPRGIAIRAWDNEWKEKDASQGLLIRFRLNPLELDAGYRLNVSIGNKILGQWLTEVARRRPLVETLRELSHCSVSYYDWDYVLLNRVAGDSLSEEAFGLEALTKASYVVIGRVFREEEIASPKLLDEVEECLVRIRDIVNGNGLYLTKEATTEVFASYEAMEPVESQPSEQESAKE